jgi:hypothetical protein
VVLSFARFAVTDCRLVCLVQESALLQNGLKDHCLVDCAATLGAQKAHSFAPLSQADGGSRKSW